MKKAYITPQINIFYILSESILAHSGLKTTEKEANEEYEVLTKEKNWRDQRFWD